MIQGSTGSIGLDPRPLTPSDCAPQEQPYEKPTGTSFIAISNTAAIPIDGTFSNLPDGGTISVESNTFQASYEGGDGNDLSLTVLP